MSEIESKFEFDELFFSRTDSRGMILSGNSVFQRVSEYSWDQLLNQPHNVVRHQDMPRGVFYLFWQMLKSRKAIGAFVKNRSKSGSYYWVYALALPLEDGYLSIRIKPSSVFFEKIIPLYQNLLDQEQNKNLPPEQSCQNLLTTLNKLNFSSYQTFMTEALISELNSRQQKLMLPPHQILAQLDNVLKLSTTLQEKSQELLQQYTKISNVSLNLTLKANQLTEEGGPLAVIAKKYSELTNEIKNVFAQFEKTSEFAQFSVKECQYSLGAVILQLELLEFFKKEKIQDKIDLNNEMNILKKICKQAIKSAVSILEKINKDFVTLNNVCEELNKTIIGLEIVRLSGKIEVARLKNEKEQLDHIITSLQQFKQWLDGTIKNVVNAGENIKKNTENIIQELKSKTKLT